MGNLYLEEKWPQIGTMFINDIENEFGISQNIPNLNATIT